jgi:hypothetical protein
MIEKINVCYIVIARRQAATNTLQPAYPQKTGSQSSSIHQAYSPSFVLRQCLRFALYLPSRE